MADILAMGTGRRKTAIARVYLKEGSGTVTVNGRTLEDYFSEKNQAQTVILPLEETSTLTTYDITIRVEGGGGTGQADACKHGVSRALAKVNDSYHSILRTNGYLRRDARMVERKKYGRRGARRRFQFSKR